METKGVLLFTDFHAHIWSEFSKPDTKYVNDRFKHQIEVLDSMLSYARDNQLDVLFAGDLFHKRIAVDTIVFNSVFKTFARHQDDGNTIYLIRGNHDSYNNRLESPTSLSPLSVLPNIQVVDKPAIFTKDNVTFYLMPYGEDTDTMISLFNEWATKVKVQTGTTILAGHVGINGAKQGATTHRLASIFSANDLHPEDYNLTYLGHYHERQEIYNSKESYVYARDDNDVPDKSDDLHQALYGGSTIPVSFSDENQIKGFDTYDYTTHERVFHPVDSPRFVTLHDWTDDLKKEYANDYVRLQLPEDKAEKVVTAEKDNSSIRVEAQVDYKINKRIDVSATDSPVKVTKTYTEKMYPELTQLAGSVIKEVLND